MGQNNKQLYLLTNIFIYSPINPLVALYNSLYTTLGGCYVILREFACNSRHLGPRRVKKGGSGTRSGHHFA